MNILKRSLALLLVVCMMLVMAPVSAFAAEDDAAVETTEATVPETAVPETTGETTVPTEEPIPETTGETTVPTEEPVEETTEPAEIPSLLMDLLGMPVAAQTLDTTSFYRIFHLDCGRKYFSVQQIKDLIDLLAENNYTHIELAVGNDALRLLLDDMSVTVGDTTYSSEDVTAGIRNGNTAYYNDGNGNALTQSEMDTIISYATDKGIGVIPLINSPGHMDSILDCMEYVGISSPAYNNSARTVDVTNTAAVNFTLALVNKYIAYFAGKGCTIFNMGCDEYANDTGNGFSGLISRGQYGNFVTYVNAMAAQVKTAGMTPMAFNDGIYYNSNTSGGAFDTDIAIAYWTAGWTGYSPASAAFLNNMGHKIISTNDNWYYVLGRGAGDSRGYSISTAQNGVNNVSCTTIPGSTGSAVGCMICLWCDTPSASYSSSEVSNVTGLLEAFAKNNPNYFTPDSGTDPTDPVDPTDPSEPDPTDPDIGLTKKTITLEVGDTATDTVSGDQTGKVDRANLNETIATVSVEYTQQSGGNTGKKETSITSGSAYYIRNSDGKYLKYGTNAGFSWVDDIDSATAWTAVYRNNNGYRLRLQGSNNTYLQYSNGSLRTTTRSNNSTTWTFSNGTFSSGTYTLGDAYTLATATAKDETTVTFTGVKPGTTYVTVGSVQYTINVTAEPLKVEFWITNKVVTDANGKTSLEISATDANSEEGIDLSTLMAEPGSWEYTTADDDGLVYWKGTVLDSDNHQTTDGGDDETADGDDFTQLRYWNGSWQYLSTSDNTWKTIASTDQVVAYWLQPKQVTPEVKTLVKDWPYTPDNQHDNVDKVALTIAVVYPDGTVSPAEGDMYSNSTLLYNYWSGRDIGIIAAVNNSQYNISKITVTDGTRDQSGTGEWGTSDTITWKKVKNEDAGTEWYDETTYWDKSMNTAPMVNGAISDITWPAYNTAKLVLIYLEPVHYNTNLIVKWVDDNDSALISQMEVSVSADGTPITFFSGLKQTSDVPQTGGTFTLDDAAYVTNSSGVNQTFNKDITTLTNVDAKYRTGLYQYVGAELSTDGMTLTLHYNLDNAKLEKTYVVDFGLGVNIPLSDLVKNPDEVVSVQVADSDSGKATVNDDKSITYQPSDILLGTDYITVTAFLDNGTASFTGKIGFVPASTVYYEEGYATYKGTGWTETGSKGTGTQAKQPLGESTDAYGYDSAYASGIGASNGTQATSGTVGDSLTFTFSGTGFEIYANCDTSTGYLSSVVIRNESGATVKAFLVNTVAADGNSDVTTGQAASHASLPIISDQSLSYGTYTVTVTHIVNDSPIHIDGFRIYGTLGTDSSIYAGDEENNPSFIELRDQVLASLSAKSDDSLQYADQIAANTYSQVYATAGTTAGVVITSKPDTYGDNLTDLLDNGPKNEIFLHAGQALTFKVNSGYNVQVGLKAPNAQADCTIKVDDSETAKTIGTSTDMFYTVLKGAAGEHTVTITNTGSAILSVTKLKVCGDSTAALAALTADDLIPAMQSLGFEKKPDTTDPAAPVDPVDPVQPVDPVDPVEPEVPEEPEVTYADAQLSVVLVDYAGKTVSSGKLTANGVENENHTFTADEIRAAAENVMPAGYAFAAEEAIASAEVDYGKDGTVKVQVGKAAVLKVTYVSIFGRKLGTATITKVQTSAGTCRISASEVRGNAPAGRRAAWLTNVKVPFGSEKSIVVSAF